MKTSKRNLKGCEIFRNELAQKWYNKIAENSNIYEAGIDTAGNVYFAWLNGNIERYTRRQFLNYCKKLELRLTDEAL